MKISDIITEDFHNDIKRDLTKAGLKFLGQGMDQMAFYDPKRDAVLKLFGHGRVSTTTGLSTGHTMFARWAKFCRDQNNPFLPRFSEAGTINYKGDIYVRMWMERLYPIGDQRLRITLAQMASIANHWGGAAPNFTKVRDLIKRMGVENRLPDSIAKPLYTTLVRLAKIGDKNGWDNDLHSENFMQRKDGTIVILDPWTTDEYIW